MAGSGLDKLDFTRFDQLLNEQDPFNSARPVFDLTQIRLITSAALVQLTSACFALSNLGHKPVILVDDTSVRFYLIRSGFVDAVGGIVSFRPAFSDSERNSSGVSPGSNPLLIEVTKIQDYKDVVDVMNRFLDVLISHLLYPSQEAYRVATIVSEIFQNTYDHNDNSCGFAAMQVYGHDSMRFLEVGVTDYGYGFAATLAKNQKNGPINSDLAAIHFALQQGTSEYDDPTRGNGLYYLCDAAYKHRGTVQIRSGTSTIYFRMDQAKVREFVGAFMPGVQIALKLPIKTIF